MLTIQEKIKDIDLLEVMRSSGVELRQYGSRFKAVCPFHGDTDPSLIVSERGGKMKWHCFGCGAGGDVVDFIAMRDRVSAKDALQSLGLLERKTHDQRKYYKKRRRTVAEFKRHIRYTRVALNRLMEMWVKFIKIPGNEFKHPEGYNHFNKWWHWDERLSLGSDEEKYNLSKEITVNVLVSQARQAGIL